MAGYYLSGQATSAGMFVPNSQRLMDTRQGYGAAGPLHGQEQVDLTVAPTGVTATNIGAVVLNVTATQTTASGYITVYPGHTSRPTASNLNYTAVTTVPNMVTTGVGSGQTVTFYNGSSGQVHLLADLEGYYLAADLPISGVWLWNPADALGNGLLLGAYTPGQVPGLGDVTSLSGNYALRSDGTVEYLSGQPVPGSTDIQAISQTGSALYALGSDGTVSAMGYNFSGQLGDRYDNEQPDDPRCGQRPHQRDQDRLWCEHRLRTSLGRDGVGLGPNDAGQVGDGSTTNRLVPVQVTGLIGMTDIGAAWTTGYAIASDGTLRSWGDSTHGQPRQRHNNEQPHAGHCLHPEHGQEHLGRPVRRLRGTRRRQRLGLGRTHLGRSRKRRCNPSTTPGPDHRTLQHR